MARDEHVLAHAEIAEHALERIVDAREFFYERVRIVRSEEEAADSRHRCYAAIPRRRSAQTSLIIGLSSRVKSSTSVIG